MALWNHYRYVIAIIVFLSGFSTYLGRNNLAVAIEKMAKIKVTANVTQHSVCPSTAAVVQHKTTPVNSTETTAADTLSWTETQKGYILSSFFVGYVVMQTPAGLCIQYFGPKTLVSAGILMTSLISFLTPLMVHSLWLFITARVIMGIFQASIFSCNFALISKWIPEQERSTVISLSSIGAIAGSLVASFMTGTICAHYHWSIVFYATGGITLGVGILQLLLVTDEPQTHCCVSTTEAEYIVENILELKLAKLNGKRTKRRSFPWKQVLTSKAVWISEVPKYVFGTIHNINTLKMANYFHTILQLDIGTTGSYCAISLGVLGLSYFLNGLLADALLSRNCFKSKTTLRKCFVAMSSLGSALFFVLIPYADCNSSLALAFLIGAMAFFGCQTGGLFPLITDLTNEFAGTLHAVTNTFDMTSAIIAPQILGYLLDVFKDDIAVWKGIFYFLAAVSLLSMAVFCLFGSAEPQNWGEKAEQNAEFRKRSSVLAEVALATDGIFVRKIDDY